ncbi:hypothetical protein DV736_g2744, partial [Chaetothyriales sp. CBS 134916]
MALKSSCEGEEEVESGRAGAGGTQEGRQSGIQSAANDTAIAAITAITAPLSTFLRMFNSMASDNATITRLHISPLTPDLLLAALGPQLLKTAGNITFHSIQTAPDRPFGYVDLPSMEADKAKKKLHGAILKGKKMKVEDARPMKRRHGDVDDSETAQAPKDQSQTRLRKKRTADRNTLPGHELPPERNVKRGWTEPKPSSKKDRKTRTTPGRPTSKFTDKEELLFRTKLPDNRADMGAKPKKNKTTTTTTTPTPTNHVVHEFERNTVEPTFLKDESRKGPDAGLHFVDGQGWLDGEGNVVEKEPANLLQRRKAKRAKASLQADKAADPAADPAFSGPPPTPQDATLGDMPQLHPLEVIFKKPQKPGSSQDVAKPSLEVQTSFSFFGGIIDDDLEDEPHEPLTPFTSQDMRFRGLRSAAPTPDTARPSRFNSYSSIAQSVDDGSQSGQDESQDPAAGEPERRSDSQTTESSLPVAQESQFVKAFWEKRGENNRGWKSRRRTVLKEKRQRENRARRPKNWEIQCDFELTPANSVSPFKNSTVTLQDEKPKPIPSTSSANGSNASPVLPRVSPFDAPDLLSTRKTTDLAITDLKLLHHYTTVVAPELSLPRRPESLVMWQVDCVQLGFKHDFLLRGLLAVAAFEMCQSHPDQKAEYEVLASHHQSLALASYRETLQDVNASNSHAVFAFSCVLIVMAFASSTKEQPSDFNSDILQWFYLLRGANMVLNMHADTIRCSFLEPLITEMDTVKTTPTYTIPDTDQISDLFRICGIPNHEREVAQTYSLAIHSLLSTFTQVSVCRNSNESPVLASFVWPITLPPQFLDLLSEKQPEALVILAYYCVVIYWGELDNTWFLRGWASYMLETIKQSVPENWRDHLKWPDEIIK